jgi:aminocarboxymuconate-semialdehyde decarboxylase
MTIDVHGHLIPESLLQNPEFDLALEGTAESGLKIKAWGVTVDAVREDLFNPGIQAQAMVAEGIDKRVISLPPFLFGYGKESSWAKNWAQAGNDALSAICAKSSGRFLGFGIVPLQDTDLAAAEMRRCLYGLGLSGIEIGTQVKGQDLDQEAFASFFEEADRLKCSVLVHPNNVSFGERISKFYLRNLVGNAMETTICVSRLWLGGFFERYPRIRLCLSHGGGAFPFLLGRLRHGSRVRPEIAPRENRLDFSPGLYVDTVVHDGKALRYLIDQCGLKSVLLGTDSPFDMGLPDPVNFVRGSVSPAAQAAILENNPESFLNPR